MVATANKARLASAFLKSINIGDDEAHVTSSSYFAIKNTPKVGLVSNFWGAVHLWGRAQDRAGRALEPAHPPLMG